MARKRAPGGTDGAAPIRQPRINKVQRLWFTPAVWLLTVVSWLLRLSCRGTLVQGHEQIRHAYRSAEGATIPCGWHRQLLMSGTMLIKTLPSRRPAGFLISPSRDGEFISRIAHNHGGTAVRGSQSYGGGARALGATRAALNSGISPMMFGDGPRGPAGKFKRGAVMLARRSGQPLLIVGCAASRYWTLNSWDKGIIPKPFARYAVAIDELIYVPADASSEAIAEIAVHVGERIDAMTALAESALG